MINQNIRCKVIGRCVISDDLGNIILNKTNAIHPMNISRAFARGLSNEPNNYIKRIAFGNGGTFIDIAQNVTYNTVNDGMYPDISGYKSRLYNETYSEIIDENSADMGTGTNSVPQDDPASSPNNLAGPGVVSYEKQNPTTKLWSSSVLLRCVLNRNEPIGQYVTDINGTIDPSKSVFEFDEIGLFTGGAASEVPTSGYQSVSFNTPNLYVNTGLSINTNYTLTIIVDGDIRKYTIFTDPLYSTSTTVNGVTQNVIKYINLVELLNVYIPTVKTTMHEGNATAGISIGYMNFTSKTSGSNSSINIVPDYNSADWLFNNILLFSNINSPTLGTDVGTQNNPNNPDQESARMLTHLIFDPIRKPMDRTYVIKYYLDIQVDRTTQ